MYHDERGCYEFNPDEAFPEECYPQHLFDAHDYACQRCDYTPDYCIEGTWGTSMDSIGPEFFECGADASWRLIRACGYPIPLCDTHKGEAERSLSSYVDKGDQFVRFDPYDRSTANDNYSESYHYHGYKKGDEWDGDCDCDDKDGAVDEISWEGFLTPSPSATDS